MARTPWKGTTGQRVEGDGPRTARVALIGEAPGADEEEVGVPFVGASGFLLFRGREGSPWRGLDALGLERETVRIENVLETRPPGNDLSVVSVAAMEQAQASLWKRLEAMPQLELVVPMGNEALNALLKTPLKKRKKRGGGQEWKWQRSISQWRGSRNVITVGGREVVMIPVVHPASFLWGDGANYVAWESDWARVIRARDGDLPEWPKLKTIVGPTWGQVDTLVRDVEAQAPNDDAVLVVDIETVGPLIDCIGFCLDGETTVTLPLVPQLWPGGGADVRRAWGVVRQLCASRVPKGTHWGYYDLFRLERQRGVKVRRWWWDSYNLHHCLNPGDEHRLSYCASRDLAVPYWKHEGNEDRRQGKKRDSWEKRHHYNGKDVGYTWHLIQHYRNLLGAQ